MRNMHPSDDPVRRVLRLSGLVLTGLLLATSATMAQQADPASRLAGRLPPDVEAAVLQRIASAQARALPAGSLADLALQGVAKARNADELLAALDHHLGTLATARQTLGGPDAPVPNTEIEAAGLALRMGVDAGAVSELARARPGGRSLEVPLLVLGGLSQRGLPADQALGRVLEGLAARVDDAGFLATLPAGAGPPVAPPAGPFSPGWAGPGANGPPAGLPAPVGPAGGRRPDLPPNAGGPPGGLPTGGPTNPGG